MCNFIFLSVDFIDKLICGLLFFFFLNLVNLSFLIEILFFIYFLLILGGGLGFLFGAFFAGAGNLDHLRPDAPKKSTWVQVKEGFRHSATRGKSMARGFALAGGVYVGCECLIEKVSTDIGLFFVCFS